MKTRDIQTGPICFLATSLNAGGMERVTAMLVHYFSVNKNIDVHIILYGIDRQVFFPLPTKVLLHQPRFSFNNSFRLFSTIRTLFYLRKTVKKINPISVLSFGEYWNSFVLLALYGLKFRVFVSDRGQPDKSLGKLHDMIRKWLYPKTYGVIAQTKAAKEIYQKMFNSTNICVIGNPIRSIPDKKLERENIILMVGRLIRSKNQDKLIELFAAINMPDWRLIIVGDDHLQQQNMRRLQELIFKLKLNDRVILAGKQKNVEEYYLKSKIFAFTSTSEGFPNVIGEAMSAGLPVVAFDCVAGPSEMISNEKNGYLIPLNDFYLFQIKLTNLMMDGDLRKRMGEQARIDIRQFDSSTIAEKFYSVLVP